MGSSGTFFVLPHSRRRLYNGVFEPFLSNCKTIEAFELDGGAWDRRKSSKSIKTLSDEFEAPSKDTLKSRKNSAAFVERRKTEVALQLTSKVKWETLKIYHLFLMIRLARKLENPQIRDCGYHDIVQNELYSVNPTSFLLPSKCMCSSSRQEYLGLCPWVMLYTVRELHAPHLLSKAAFHQSAFHSPRASSYHKIEQIYCVWSMACHLQVLCLKGASHNPSLRLHRAATCLQAWWPGPSSDCFSHIPGQVQPPSTTIVLRPLVGLTTFNDGRKLRITDSSFYCRSHTLPSPLLTWLDGTGIC